MTNLQPLSLGELIGVGPARHEQLVAAWLAGYRVEKTRIAYAHSLRTWFDFCGLNAVDPLAAIRAHVDLYMRSLEAAGLADRTVASRISALSAFYTYLVDEDVLPKSPVRGVKRPKIDKVSPTGWLTRPQVADLIAAAHLEGPICHALVCILALNGLRIAEACSLNVESLIVEHGFYPCLTFVRKGGKQARAALSRPAEAAVHAVIGDRTAGPLLTTTIGTRMNQKAAQLLLDRCAPSVRGEHPHITPHVLRHSWATLALLAGAIPEQVRHDGGWADDRMLTYYGSHGADDPARSSTHLVAGLIMGVG